MAAILEFHARLPDGPVTGNSLFGSRVRSQIAPRVIGLRRQGGIRHSNLRLVTPDDCAASPSRGYIVKGLIAPSDLILMVAKPGGGKSALAPSIGYAIAQGREVFGRRTKPGLVFYVPVEDPHGMRGRVHALKRTHGNVESFLIVEGVNDLFNADSPDPDALLELAADRLPALVIIDTLAAAWRGVDEIKGDQMARVIEVSRSLTAVGCAVMLLCHPNKLQISDGTARGHGSLDGDADLGLYLEPPVDGTIMVRITKNRNGPAYASSMGFTIKGVWIGEDEDGDGVFAPVAQEADDAAVLSTRKLKSDMVALGFLATLIAVKGSPLPVADGFPDSIHGVSEEDWRADCDMQRLSTAETEANRTRVFRRAYADLIRKKRIGARDGLVWIPEPEAGT